MEKKKTRPRKTNRPKADDAGTPPPKPWGERQPGGGWIQASPKGSKKSKPGSAKSKGSRKRAVKLLRRIRSR